jgi:hypothetical protein
VFYQPPRHFLIQSSQHSRLTIPGKSKEIDSPNRKNGRKIQTGGFIEKASKKVKQIKSHSNLFIRE